MKEEMAKDDGWVSIATLMTFNRMKSLTEDPAVVLKALRTPHPDLTDSIEISEDESKVRRKVPFVDLTDEQVAELNNRTIHFKGISLDATLDEVRAFCSQYGKVVSVEMRRMREDRKFKVSIFYFVVNLLLCLTPIPISSISQTNTGLRHVHLFDPGGG
jgi:hypothetical protein